MAIETGLRTLLLAQSSITALVPAQTIKGQSLSGIFCEHPEQGFLPPFILISKIDTDPWLTLGNSLGTRATDFDFDCYSYTYPGALAIAAAVKAFIEDYTGAAGADNTIKAVLWMNGRSDQLNEGQGRDVRQFIESLSFTIQHT